MPDRPIDAETAEKRDLKQLEESLKMLWEKARLVSDTLLRIKAENKELRDRISSLEIKEHSSAEELQRRENDLLDVKTQLTRAQSNGSNLFSKEELEILKLRLRELITKINSRL